MSDNSNSAGSSASSSSSTSVTTVEEQTPFNLDVKFVDSRYEEEKNVWEYEDTKNLNIPAEQVQPLGTNTADDKNSWEKYCFVVVRKHLRVPQGQPRTIAIEIVIKSPYLRTACKEVMQGLSGISWVSEPLTIDPKHFITFFPKLEAYERDLSARTRTEDEDRVLTSLRVLLEWLRTNYRQTLARISSLLAHGEITFDLMYALLVPGSIIVRRCPVTRETRALRLVSAHRQKNSCGEFFALNCVGLEEMVGDGDNDDDEYDERPTMLGWTDDDLKKRQFGMVTDRAVVWAFSGVEKINTLAAYPLEYHPDPTALTATLVARARRWMSLSGVHHMHYRGTASRVEWIGGKQKLVKYSVKSRIMVDKGSFNRVDADYELPSPDRPLAGRDCTETLTEDELLLASPIVYGFSFSDKMWLEFNVNHVAPIEWNDEAFAGLVLPAERKTLLRSLIEAHSHLNASGEGGFDDFVRGKGQGLVINLFGPPGVGKTLSAEATSEHLRRPLYIVGSGDLGTSAHELDQALDKAFDLAACWNAVLLIDEADVFLEQRSLHDMERNAMVAVFLRHVEYYRGILFLTTNRIKTFDEAFLSRIHVALHFSELSTSTKVQIWRAFLKKAGVDDAEVSQEVLEKLSAREINGRQIKNACRTATSLAVSRGEKIQYKHLDEALNAMDEFMSEFAAIQGPAA